MSKERLEEINTILKLVKEEFGPEGTPICPFTITEKDMNPKIQKYLKEKGFKRAFMKLLVNPVDNDIKSYVGKRLGTRDTVDGETWIAVIPVAVEIDEDGFLLVGADIARKPYDLAFKLLPLEITDIIKEGSLERNVWRELHILREMTDHLLQKNAPPGLPVLYGHYLCPNASQEWTNPSIIKEVKYSDPIKEFGKRGLIILNELESYDLGYWMKNILSKLDNPREQINVLIWTLFAVMAYLQIHLQFVHLDFHLGNILVREMKPKNGKEHWEFQFGENRFYVPNEGYLFIVFDFFRSLLLGIDKPLEVIKRLIPEMRYVFGRSVLNPVAGKIALNIKQNPSIYLPYVYAYDSFRFLNSFLNTVKRMNLSGIRLGIYYTMMNEAHKALIDDLPKKKLPAIRPAISQYPIGSPAYLFEKYLTKKEFKEKIKNSKKLNDQPYVIS